MPIPLTASPNGDKVFVLNCYGVSFGEMLFIPEDPVFGGHAHHEYDDASASDEPEPEVSVSDVSGSVNEDEMSDYFDFDNYYDTANGQPPPEAPEIQEESEEPETPETPVLNVYRPPDDWFKKPHLELLNIHGEEFFTQTFQLILSTCRILEEKKQRGDFDREYDPFHDAPTSETKKRTKHTRWRRFTKAAKNKIAKVKEALGFPPKQIHLT